MTEKNHPNRPDDKDPVETDDARDPEKKNPTNVSTAKSSKTVSNISSEAPGESAQKSRTPYTAVLTDAGFYAGLMSVSAMSLSAISAYLARKKQ